MNRSELRSAYVSCDGRRVLAADRHRLSELLDLAVEDAKQFLEGLDEQPVGQRPGNITQLMLPLRSMGLENALKVFRQRYGQWLSGSPGPRYFAFVTGGATPAALAGDWLTSTFDQNASDAGESCVRQLSLDAVHMFRELLTLPDEFDGVFVTGATMSNFVGLALARQWLGHQRGADVAADGVGALSDVAIFSGTAHSSIYKGLAMLGLGRRNLRTVATLPDREAVDVDALDAALTEWGGPAIFVANAGTVNSCDFDDFQALQGLRQRHDLWIHVDGAFGAVAACSERFRPLMDGFEGADSITVDAHKWLNVPYDCALILTRHLELQGEVFRSMAPYLEPDIRPDTFLHLTPENSQRWRALPVWMTLAAYGKEGYAVMVERCCDLAHQLGQRIDGHDRLRLLAPVRLNGIVFGLLDASGQPADSEATRAYLDRLEGDGTAFLTPTSYQGEAAVRVSITNWRTEQADIDATWEALVGCL